MFVSLSELLNQPCVSGRGVSAMLDDESAPTRLAELINSQMGAGINAAAASATTALPAASAERSKCVRAPPPPDARLFQPRGVVRIGGAVCMYDDSDWLARTGSHAHAPVLSERARQRVCA